MNPSSYLSPVPDPASPVPQNRRRSRRRLWAFRVAAILFPFVALALVELLLLLFGAGDNLDLVIAVPGEPEQGRFQLNPLADRPYFGVTELGGPEERRFEIPKPERTFRIVVIGASTVFGFPYAPELAFPRQLEVALQQQVSDRNYEVLNAGITAINSFALVDITRHIVEADPDLIIVHAGHNEFYGPGGAASTSVNFPPAVYRAAVELRRTRLAQVTLGRLLESRAPDKELTEILPRTLEIPLGGPMFKRAEQQYRDNLERIVAISRGAGVPVLLTTVASNLKDQSPIRSFSTADLSPPERSRWEQLCAEGMQHMGSENWEQAVAAFESAERLDGTTALLTFRKAQCLEALGRQAAALQAFELARDQDGCRFRAPSSFAEIVRQVGEAHRDQQVYFCDTAGEILAASAPHAPGHDLFLEHVHYNLEGHWRLAGALARFIRTEVHGEEWEREPSAEERDRLLDVTPYDRLAGYSFALQLTGVSPMNGSADNPAEANYLSRQIEQEFRALPVNEAQRFADLSMAEIGTELLLSLGQRLIQAGETEAGLELLRKNARRRPWSVEACVALARALAETGRTAEAEEWVGRAGRLAPKDSRIPLLQAAVREESERKAPPPGR